MPLLPPTQVSTQHGSNATYDELYSVLQTLLRLETGSLAEPTLITDQIVPAEVDREMIILAGDGAVTLTATPNIVAGDGFGEELVLMGTSNTDTVTLNTGNGTQINGSITLRSGSIITLVWNGSTWLEVSRNGL